MRHSVVGKKLSRNTDERKRLLTVLVRDMFIRDGIVTSFAKAKSRQPMVEKLITTAKSKKENDLRSVAGVVGDRKLASQIIDQAGTRFASRTSGYTRIVRIGKRVGDSTDTAKISFVDVNVVAEVVKPAKETKEVVQKEQPVKKEEKPKKKTAKKTVKK